MAPGQGEHPDTGAAPPGGAQKLSRVTSKSGKSATVNEQYAPAFQSLIDYLDGVGYDIYSLGGYVDRDVRGQSGVKSVHAHGGALDINPGSNPMGATLVTDMPEGIGEVARSLGLGWGGNWKSLKDAMHFSVAKNEGGSFDLPALEHGGKLDGVGLVGEKGPELAVGPASITSNNDIMNAFNNLASLLERSLNVQETIARASNTTADLNSKILSYAQN